jgi:hypothetical protein
MQKRLELESLYTYLSILFKLELKRMRSKTTCCRLPAVAVLLWERTTHRAKGEATSSWKEAARLPFFWLNRSAVVGMPVGHVPQIGQFGLRLVASYGNVFWTASFKSVLVWFWWCPWYPVTRYTVCLAQDPRYTHLIFLKSLAAKPLDVQRVKGVL